MKKKELIKSLILEVIQEFQEEIPDTVDYQGDWIDPDPKHIEDQVKLAACLFDVSYEEMVSQMAKSKTVTLTDKVWAQLDNTLSYNIPNVEKAKEIADEYGYHYNDAMFGYANDREMSKPIVVYKKGSPPYVVSGEPELLFASAFNIQPKILMVIL